MTSMDDALSRAARGDQDAFAELIRGHESIVYSLALHFLHDRPAAEGVSQEVFWRLYQHLASIQSSAHLLFWLRRVTTQRCIEAMRQRRAANHWSLEDIPERGATDETSDCMLEQVLRRLVASLPDKSRAVVILRYQEDLDPAEIAELLDMPVNTVKSHLQRSLALLRTKLAALKETKAYAALGR